MLSQIKRIDSIKINENFKLHKFNILYNIYNVKYSKQMEILIFLGVLYMQFPNFNFHKMIVTKYS